MFQNSTRTLTNTLAPATASSPPLRRRALMFGLALAFGAAAVSAQVVNPGFDNDPPGPGGPIGNFGNVVVGSGGSFDPGYWGAEISYIVAETGPITPASPPYMLEMHNGGGSHTEAWQVIRVPDGWLPSDPHIGMSAKFNVPAAAAGAVGSVQIRTFRPGQVWPNVDVFGQASCVLDGDPSTWETLTLAPVAIHPDTQWILIAVNYTNATLGPRGYVDDVKLEISSGCHSCYADCDGNGVLNIDDFLCFINRFAIGCPPGTCN